MNILGLADGFDAGAALLVDDHVVAVVEQERLVRKAHTRELPWAAAEAVLAEGGLTPADVDIVALAGRFSPPFFLRRHPGLRGLARDAFSPLLDAKVFYQAMLRQSGLGALEADRTADWMGERLRERGYGMRRTLLVDVHRCLAEAAHRTQPADPVLVVTVHPNGDGVALASYRGSAGQLDRLWAQKGFASLHVHIRRCLESMGLDPSDEPRAWALAADAEPDPDLVAHLDGLLHAEGLRLSRKRYPFPERRRDYAPIRAVEVPVAAASLLENLARTVTSVVHAHARRAGLRTVALGGGVFENPWLVSRIAALDVVDQVWTPPLQGWASMALGAAASVAGLAPAPIRGPGLGTTITEGVARRALVGRSAAAARPDAVAEVLLRGGAVGRCVGRGGFGRHGGGTRTVLVTASGLASASAALGRDPREAATWATLDRTPSPVSGPLRFGAAAGATPLGLRPIYRVDDTEDADLAEVLRLVKRAGHDGLALLPFGRGLEPTVELAADAVDTFTSSSLEALWLGPFLVRR